MGVETFEFEVGLWPHALTLEEYRPTFVPRPELRSTGVFASAYLTNDAGQRYHGQRAFDDVEIGKSHVYSFCSVVDGDVTKRPPELYEAPRAEQREPYSFEELESSLVWTTEACRLEVSEGAWHWSDAGGRWDLEVESVADVPYYFWVPVQEGFRVCQYHRGEMGRARGTVNGEPVRGFTYLDYSYGPRDIDFQFFELPLIRKMNKAWMVWYADFADGGFTTGAARKGRDGVNWSMAYVVHDGKAKVLTPTTTDLTYAANGVIRHARLDTGEEVLEFEQDAATMYPLHTVGRVASCSLRGEITDSWTNMEWMADNSEEMLQAWAEGRVTREASAAMRIVGERMVIPGITE